MTKLLPLLVFSCIAIFCCLQAVSSAATKPDNLGRYTPQYHNNYYNSHYYKNRDFYQKRNFYDKFFKKYHPNVVDAQAAILEQNVQSPQQGGAYEYSYETENGIHAEERGVPINAGQALPYESVQGFYTFLTPEGLRVGVKYTANENGFHPVITYDDVNAALYANQPQPADVVITKIN